MDRRWQILRLWLSGGLCCLTLNACVSARIPPPSPNAAVLKPALLERSVFQASDGAELAMAQWSPPAGTKVRAQVLLVHGFNEYAGVFEESAPALARQGLVLWALDQRGFGRSPYRGLWSSTARMALDVIELARTLKTQQPDQPLYVLGTSMGGAVALVAAAQEGKDALVANGLILVAPAVWTRATQPLYQRLAMELARKYAPSWTPTGEGLRIQPSDNRAALRRIWQSPWMIRATRMDTLYGLLDLMDQAYAAAPKVRIPVLLLYGAKDQLVPAKPVQGLWAQLPKQARNRFIHYPQGWHMLLNDLQAKQVISDIGKWLLNE